MEDRMKQMFQDFLRENLTIEHKLKGNDLEIILKLKVEHVDGNLSYDDVVEVDSTFVDLSTIDPELSFI